MGLIICDYYLVFTLFKYLPSIILIVLWFRQNPSHPGRVSLKRMKLIHSAKSALQKKNLVLKDERIMETSPRVRLFTNALCIEE